MSWSLQKIGKVSAVRKAVATDIAKLSITIPEELALAQQAGVLIDNALDAMPQNGAVKVSASGSAGYSDYTNKVGLYNQLAVEVVPVYGFVE